MGNIKTTIAAVRLAFGAAEAIEKFGRVPDEFVDQVSSARVELEGIRGTEVIEAVRAIQRVGMSLALSMPRPGTPQAPGKPESRFGKRFA